MFTGLSTWTMPLVDSHVTGIRSVTLDTAASPIDISSHSAAVRLLTPRRAEPKSSLPCSVLAPSTAVTVCCSPSRSTTMTTESPGSWLRTVSPRSSGSSMASPPIESTTSPDSMPAACAGPPLSTTPISAPGRSTSSPRVE